MKESEPNASPRPPSAWAFDCGCCVGDASGGDDIPENAFAFDCAGGGAGFDAYRDKMDCFRSDLPPEGAFGPVLDGLAGGVDCDPPKKSMPSKLSPALCLGGAIGAFGGAALLIDGSVVLGLAGCAAGSAISPNKSICGCCARGGPGTIPIPCPFLPLALLSRSFTCCCTTFSGTSSSAPPSSSVLGSGIGPSITHRLLSYLVRMKFSIFASLGT